MGILMTLIHQDFFLDFWRYFWEFLEIKILKNEFFKKIKNIKRENPPLPSLSLSFAFSLSLSLSLSLSVSLTV